MAIPLIMGFRLIPSGAWRTFELSIDIFFILDFCISFLKGYVDKYEPIQCPDLPTN